MKFRKTPIVLAIAALAASPAVFAGGGGYLHHYGQSGATSEIMDMQLSVFNRVFNYRHDNNATLGSGALSNAKGNVSVNIAAGDNNAQDNATAVSDASFVFGNAKASVRTFQGNFANGTLSLNSSNSAGLTSNALTGAKGNIQVNVAAGESNLQKNNLAVAVSSGRLASVSVDNMQMTGGNGTVNASRCGTSENQAYLSSGALAGASGNIAVNIASGSGNLQSNSTGVAVSYGGWMN